LLLKAPLVHAPHLSQILLVLLPGALAIIFPPAQFILALAPGLLFMASPVRAPLICPPAIVTSNAISIAAVPAVAVRIALIVFIALPLPLSLLLGSLTVLDAPLLFQNPSLLLILLALLLDLSIA
jgi:hypothetical protein